MAVDWIVALLACVEGVRGVVRIDAAVAELNLMLSILVPDVAAEQKSLLMEKSMRVVWQSLGPEAVSRLWLGGRSEARMLASTRDEGSGIGVQAALVSCGCHYAGKCLVADFFGGKLRWRAERACRVAEKVCKGKLCSNGRPNFPEGISRSEVRERYGPICGRPICRPVHGR